jgi:hypothetical protein
MNASLFIFLAATLVSAFLLVALYRQEDKLAPPPSDPDAHWLARRRAVVFPLVRTALVHGAVAAFLAIMSVAAWGLLAEKVNLLSALPPETAPLMQIAKEAREASELAALPSIFADTPLLHYVALTWIGVFFLSTVSRCLDLALYDIFVSYKSEDVAVARRIAETLIGAGWNVWFAEYRILLERRAQFMPMFGLGALDSWYGLLITNDRWAQSRHCAREARILLGTMGPKRILEVRAPSQPLPHQYFPRLSQCAALETTDPAKVLRFVEAHTNHLAACPEHLLPRPAPIGGRRFSSYYEGRSCSIEVGDWDLFGDPASMSGISWGYKQLPSGVLDGHVGITPLEADRLAREKRWGLGEAFMFDVMAHHARKVIKSFNGFPRGVHLFYYQDRPQMGLTYWTDSPPYWHRSMMFDALNPTTGQAANFHFRFRFKGSFREYCRHAHVMDALALSLEWT